MNETNPVYFHSCPALGPNTRIPRALMLDDAGEYILCHYYKCPFCSTTAGEIEYAPGVTPLPTGGYSVDTSKAEKLHDA